MPAKPYAPPALPGLTVKQKPVSPRSQFLQKPHAMLNGRQTQLPTLIRSTASPISMTWPRFSWPSTRPGSISVRPSYACRSSLRFHRTAPARIRRNFKRGVWLHSPIRPASGEPHPADAVLLTLASVRASSEVERAERRSAFSEAAVLGARGTRTTSRVPWPRELTISNEPPTSRSPRYPPRTMQPRPSCRLLLGGTPPTGAP
jgi:hypothetical protein